jgi:hypothetical protein
MYIGIYTKPQFVVMVPSAGILFLFLLFRDAPKTIIRWAAPATVIALSAVLFILYRLKISTFVLFDDLRKNADLKSFFTFTYEYTLFHTYREVMPWYWGIYNWLGVTYSRPVHRIINRIMAAAALGIIMQMIFLIRDDFWRKRRAHAFLFLGFFSAVYFIAISLYDWLSWYMSTYPLGVQGRYFFPVISAHMTLFLIGWKGYFSGIIE